jgi:hypothetical protein
MTTEIYFSTFAQIARKRLADIAVALGVTADIVEEQDVVRAYFPVLSGKRQPATGVWAKIRAKTNAGPPPFLNTGVVVTVVLPEKILLANEAALQGELLVLLAPHLDRAAMAYSDYVIKDD